MIKILRAIVRNIFLVINIVFAICYLLGVLSVYVPPSRTTLIAYFGLFFPVIVFVNLFFIVFWAFKKRNYWMISAVLIFLTYSHFNRCVTIPFKNIITKKKSNIEVKMITFNMSARLDSEFGEFMDFISQEDADIVCLQEFGFYGKNKDKLKHLMNKYYPYSHIWYKHQTKRQSRGVATFSKYPIINKQKINFDSRYNISIYSDLVIEDDTIRVINNHLESNKLTKEDKQKYNEQTILSVDKVIDASYSLSNRLGPAYKIRARQAYIIEQVINDSPYPLVVCGDFNDVPQSHSYYKIKGNMTDLSTATSWGYHYTFRENGLLVAIDHILLTKSLIPISFRIPHENLSDHYPLVGVFGIR